MGSRMAQRLLAAGHSVIGYNRTKSKAQRLLDAGIQWGETPRSYDEPSLRGSGEGTASQTAWAVLGLLAAGRVAREATARGIESLLHNQQADGTWDESQFTGTGFPRVFYLKYHLYRIYFPLMALSRYARMQRS